MAVERRALGGEPYPRARLWQIVWWLQLSLIGFGTGAAVLGAFMCTMAAVQEEPLTPVASAITIFGGSAVAFVAINTTVRLAMRSFTQREADA